MRISQWLWPPDIVSTSRTIVPPVARQVDDERGVGRLGDLGVVLGAGDEDGELRAAGAGDEPLVAVDDPLVAVAVGVRLDERRVGAGHLGLGHGEARPGPALAQRPQVLAPSARRCAQCSSVCRLPSSGAWALSTNGPMPTLAASALTPRPWPSGRAPCRPTPWACAAATAPLLAGHLAQVDDRLDPAHRGRSGRSTPSSGGPPRPSDRADLQADLVDLGREGEIDHGA